MATLTLPTKTRTSAAPTIVGKGSAEEVHAYVYKARRLADDKIVKGSARALTQEDVTNELLRQGLYPVYIKGGATGSLLASDTGLRKRAKKRDLVVATELLAAMLESGLEYLEALDIVREDVEDPLLGNALNEVRTAVNNGAKLSDAIAAQGDVFPPSMVNLLAAGEESGRVPDAMRRIANQMDKEDELRSKIKKAMMYPALVFVVSAIVFAFMMFYLVPMFADTFVEIGGPGTELPTLTRAVVGVADIAKYAIPILLLIAIPGFLWYRAVQYRENVRAVVDPIKFKIPVFGRLFHKIALARFTRTLSGLLDAGVDRLQALEITARTCGNLMMERAVLKARDAQRQGRPLVDPLKEEPLFPNMVIKMTMAGERSGKTAFMLGKAADLYDRDVDEITDNMAELIQPLFMLVLGLMVGIVVVAVYMPYMNIGDVMDKGFQ